MGYFHYIFAKHQFFTLQENSTRQKFTIYIHLYTHFGTHGLIIQIKYKKNYFKQEISKNLISMKSVKFIFHTNIPLYGIIPFSYVKYSIIIVQQVTNGDYTSEQSSDAENSPTTVTSMYVKDV